MKHLKSILLVLLVATLPFSFSACSKNNKNAETKTFVGVAIYQKLEGNLNWSKFSAKPSAINNIIETIENKIIVDENPELLFYVYSQNTITSSTTDDQFISNTTRDLISINDKILSFRFERIQEDTEILIYYIYKLKDSSYFLEYKTSKSNIKNKTETIEIDITHKEFSKIKLTLETTLTIKEEY